MSHADSSYELVVKTPDFAMDETFNEAGPLGSHLRGDRLYGKVVSQARAILTVRSEIGRYRRLGATR